MRKIIECDVFVSVIIPSYRVKNHILGVIEKIGPEVSKIYVVDDCCPEKSGEFVIKNNIDTRVTVIFNAVNLGVGGSVKTGYLAALADNADIIVKIDGDGQMDPKLINSFISPIIRGDADYTKGNRFYNLDELGQMPKIRLFGNSVLSFMTKISSGYWNLFDPTNGYTAINSSVLADLSLNKISNRYFFETDMLFRLNLLRAVVRDVPMSAKYTDEVSNLRIGKILIEFSFKHMRNFIKRIFYSYYLRDMSLASFELPIGMAFTSFGMFYGICSWLNSVNKGVETSAGTVMLSALPLLMGVQLMLAFLSFDISNTPKSARGIQDKRLKS